MKVPLLSTRNSSKIRLLLLSLVGFSISPILAQTYGCRDVNATNYNASATANDGSCVYSVTNYTPTFVTTFNSTLDENSALTIVNDKFWTLNDSGNRNALYQVSATNGAILRTVIIKNAVNNDWESLAQSSTHLFIGDFGNNDGTRQNLRILKINKNDLTNSLNDSIEAEFIDFAYSDQSSFNSTPNATNFDGEALLFANDSLHIFSKNWANLRTRHYRLSANAGSSIATLQEEFNVAGLITDASISPVTGNVVLLGYKNNGTGVYNCFTWLLFDYHNTSFFSGNKRLIELGSGVILGQTEGISLNSDNTGFFTSEKVPNPYIQIPPKLHIFNFNSYFGSFPVAIKDLSDKQPYSIVYLNATNEELTIETNQNSEPTNYVIRNLFGQTLKKGKLTEAKTLINLSNNPSGSYLVSIAGSKSKTVKIMKYR
jgi:hypothetical protein